MKWPSFVRGAVLLLAIVATSLSAEEEHCTFVQELEEGAGLFDPHHATTAPNPGPLTEKQQRQQKREQRQALEESVVAFMRAQEQAFETQRKELEAHGDHAGEPEYDPVLGDMQLKMTQLAQLQEQDDPRLRLNCAHSVPEKSELKKRKVGWGGSLEVPSRGMESRGSWSWGWKESSQGKISRPRADLDRNRPAALTANLKPKQILAKQEEYKMLNCYIP